MAIGMDWTWLTMMLAKPYLMAKGGGEEIRTNRSSNLLNRKRNKRQMKIDPI